MRVVLYKISKIADNVWAIAFLKCLKCVKNKNSKKHVKSILELFCTKKRLQKTPNIRKITTF